MVGEIKIKAKLSPAELELGLSLAKMGRGETHMSKVSQPPAGPRIRATNITKNKLG